LGNQCAILCEEIKIRLLGILFASLLIGCSNVGPGIANHPISCWLGIAWDDCLPDTAGWNNGGGKIYREAAQKILNQQYPPTTDAFKDIK